ncbi:Ehepsin, putative [Acanthamoeba castellanii str. Neff]|uniref:Ehepsin, putative n=1 Tax=Acanthamoeba castellanii (strain ATCC 30010 / Neff) TaxID=1257118 RepID=L8HCS9_ACACF|nr:Ehepsin, putative [Acanthamoeba castellanii str. Neff]ELR22553.1 Ehepsin, putative [Acanthamoeba castellanii str. Neff]
MFSSSSSTRGLVDKATADDDAPTPGYLYNDLAKATFKSLKDCQVVEDQLLTRLTKSVPPAVKLKCLRVAKHCVLKGEISFKRDLQRRLGPIRACLECRGPPDPIHGDALYRQIRDEAQELMNAIFDTEDKARPRMEGTEGAGAPALASPGAPRTMGGFGGHHPESDSSSSSSSTSSASARISELFSSFKGSSSSPSSGGGGTASLSHRHVAGLGQGGDASFSRQPGAFPSAEAIEGGGDGRKYMAGMGNTDYDPHRHAPTKREEGLVAKLMRAGDAMVGGGPAAPTSNLSRGAFQGSYHSPALPRPASSSSGGSPGGYVPGVSPTVAASGSSSEGHAADGEGLAGVVSENIWERSDREWRATEASSPERAGSHADRPRDAIGTRSGGDGDDGEEEKGGDEYVQQLVNEIALPGGVRVAPPASVLAQFCLRCESLSDQQRVAAYRLLHAKLLDHQSPPVQQRALHVVAGLVKRRVAGANAFFASHDQPLRALAASPVPAARTKAAEIVEVLRVPTAAGGRAPSADHWIHDEDDAGGDSGGGGGWGWLQEEGARDEPLVRPPAATSSPTSSLFVGLSVNDDDSTGHDHHRHHHYHHHHEQQQQQAAAGGRASLLGDDPFDAFLAPLAATHAEVAPPHSPLGGGGGGGGSGQASLVEHQLHGLSLGGYPLLPSTSSPSAGTSFASPPALSPAPASSGAGRTPSSAAHPLSLLSYPTPSTTTTTAAAATVGLFLA